MSLWSAVEPFEAKLAERVVAGGVVDMEEVCPLNSVELHNVALDVFAGYDFVQLALAEPVECPTEILRGRYVADVIKFLCTGVATLQPQREVFFRLFASKQGDDARGRLRDALGFKHFHETRPREMQDGEWRVEDAKAALLASAQYLKSLVAACHTENGLVAEGGNVGTQVSLVTQADMYASFPQRLAYATENGFVALHRAGGELWVAAYAEVCVSRWIHLFFRLSFSYFCVCFFTQQKTLGLADVFSMVHVENLRKRACVDAEAVGNESALEIAHAALSFRHAAA